MPLPFGGLDATAPPCVFSHSRSPGEISELQAPRISWGRRPCISLGQTIDSGIGLPSKFKMEPHSWEGPWQRPLRLPGSPWFPSCAPNAPGGLVCREGQPGGLLAAPELGPREGAWDPPVRRGHECGPGLHTTPWSPGPGLPFTLKVD